MPRSPLFALAAMTLAACSSPTPVVHPEPTTVSRSASLSESCGEFFDDAGAYATVSCASGLACRQEQDLRYPDGGLYSTGKRGFCTVDCTTDGKFPCPAGWSCVDSAGSTSCAAPCKTSHDCASPYQVCVQGLCSIVPCEGATGASTCQSWDPSTTCATEGICEQH